MILDIKVLDSILDCETKSSVGMKFVAISTTDDKISKENDNPKQAPNNLSMDFIVTDLCCSFVKTLDSSVTIMLTNIKHRIKADIKKTTLPIFFAALLLILGMIRQVAFVMSSLKLFINRLL